jgi:hypothetical protein
LPFLGTISWITFEAADDKVALAIPSAAVRRPEADLGIPQNSTNESLLADGGSVIVDLQLGIQQAQKRRSSVR